MNGKRRFSYKLDPNYGMENRNENFNENKNGLAPSQYEPEERVLTKTVRPEWYKRYAHILPNDEMCLTQPKSELREDKKKLYEQSLAAKDEHCKSETLANKLAEEKKARVETVMTVLNCDKKNVKKSLDKLKSNLVDSNPLVMATHGTDTTATKQSTKVKEKYNRFADPDRFDEVFDHEIITLHENFKLPQKSKWRIFKKNDIIKRKFQKMIVEHKAEVILFRWRKAIRTVRAALRFGQILADISGTSGEVFKQFTQSQRESFSSESSNGSVLEFEKTRYKVGKKEKELSLESIFTLSATESSRTEAGIHKAAKELECLLSFSQFPKYYRTIMARIGWYLQVPKNKVIIREGQHPDNFYFMMSGKAASLKLIGSAAETEQGDFHVQHIIGRDTMFGEDGLFDCDHRASSIISVEDCRILSVNIHDYTRLTLVAESADQNPEHIRILSQLESMQYFNMKQLIDNPYDGNIILFYFSPGKVVTRKTSESKYLFVVKSGGCRVLMKVNAHRCADSIKTLNVIVPPSADADNKHVPEENHHKHWSFKSERLNEIRSCQSLESKSKLPRTSKWWLFKTNNDVKRKFRAMMRDVTKVRRISDDKDGALKEVSESYSSRSSRLNLIPPKPTTIQISDPNAGGGRLDKGVGVAVLEHSIDLVKAEHPFQNKSDRIIEAYVMNTPTLMQVNEYKKQSTVDMSFVATPATPTSAFASKLSVATSLQKAAIVEKLVTVPGQSKVTTSSVWVHLKELRENDMFGLGDMDFGDGAHPLDVAVVSEGAEIILVSKKYFMENSSAEMLSYLRASSHTLPDDDMVAKQLQKQQHWQSYCQKVREQHEKKHSSPR